MARQKRARQPHPLDARVGEAVRKARLNAGLTRAELGAALVPPVEEAQIERYESGFRRFGGKQLIAVGAVLDIDPDSLFEAGSVTEDAAGAEGPAEGALPLVIFAHIPSAGGTTFWTVLRSIYGRHGIRRVRGLGMGTTTRAVQLLVEDRSHAVKVVGGHVRIDLRLLEERPLRFITLLRDPTAVQLSRLLRATRKRNPDFEITEDYIAENMLERRPNPLIRFLRTQEGYRRDEITDEVTGEDLERAKETLTNHVHSFGLTERFDESLALMAAELGWPAVPDYGVKNRSNNKPREIPPAIWESWRARNALDYEFYAFAERLFDQRLAGLPRPAIQAGPRTEAESRAPAGPPTAQVSEAPSSP